MSDGLPLGGTTTFLLDGQEVEARMGETIWQVASRLGTDIPHLCHSPKPGYRPDGNCRACVVESRASARSPPPASAAPRPA